MFFDNNFTLTICRNDRFVSTTQQKTIVNVPKSKGISSHCIDMYRLLCETVVSARFSHAFQMESPKNAKLQFTFLLLKAK